MIRIAQVVEMTGLARSTIYLLIKQNRFPKPVQLGLRAVRWPESEVNDWIGERIQSRGVK